MSELVAITYIGRLPGFKANVNGRKYEFEWRKSLGVGSRADEVRPQDAQSLSQMKDRRTGKKMFFLDKKSDTIN